MPRSFKLKHSNMAFLTLEERVFIVIMYARTANTVTVQREFRRRFNRPPPHRNTIFYNVAKYQNLGTSADQHQVSSGRDRMVRTGENIDAVYDMLQQHPNFSARRNPLQISKSSFNRITRT